MGTAHPATSALGLSLLVLFIAFFVSGLMAITMDLCFGHQGQSLIQYYTQFWSESDADRMKLSSGPYPNDVYDNLFTFVQISDLHISKFRLLEIKEELKDFCKSYLPFIMPSIVLVTGDLVDAKDITNYGSRQYKEEWQSYRNVVKHCQNHWKGEWLEVRGNHDAFAVLDHDDNENMYRKFSNSKDKYGRSGSYQYVFRQDFGSYAFNALDFAPNPGPRRPFNFFGIVEEEDLEFMQIISEKRHLHNMTIWFGHYPLSTITTTALVRKVVSQDLAYLCGHLHTMGNFLPVMHLMLPNGHMELESGDWKESKRYRILAVDHDLLSFVDVQYPDLPVILITNPLPTRYANPRRQPFDKMRKSTHIRFLVFGKQRVTNATVRINDHVMCGEAKNVKHNLYVCPWEPARYAKGIYNLTVVVKDTGGKKTTRSINFSLEGLTESSYTLGSLILFMDFCLVARTLFCCIFLVVVVLPLFLRQALSSPKQHILAATLPYLPTQVVQFLKNDELLRPWIYYNLYILIGPTFIGEMIPGSIGLCFVHGLWVNGNWLPGTLTYVYGGFQLVVYSVPLAVYLGELSSKRKSLPRPTKLICGLQLSGLKTLLFHALFSLIVFYQVSSSLSLRKAYGNMACLLSPVKTWSIPFAIWLVYVAVRDSR